MRNQYIERLLRQAIRDVNCLAMTLLEADARCDDISGCENGIREAIETLNKAIAASALAIVRQGSTANDNGK